MTLVHVGFVTPNKYNFLPENTCKYSKYRDEIWTIEGDMEKIRGWQEDVSHVGTISHPK